MHAILAAIEALGASRDRRQLARLLVRATGQMFGHEADIAFFCQERDQTAEILIYTGPGVSLALEESWILLLRDKLLSPNIATTCILADRTYGIVPLHASELGETRTFLAFSTTTARYALEHETLLCLARVYGNQLRLLDYSELDSLTRLLNRKTFDETFDRLLTHVDSHDDPALERRTAESGEAWLCVIDIDHFKRINDTFGHLFGDEVLLRIGDLMRKTFRSEDRLFRFGGEEFVVILNADGPDHATRGFDRFRQAVESHEFPQVGQVTCSIGFTRAGGADVPTDVLGRADEALYFGKKNGRNQVNGYEQLIVSGAIAAPVAVESTTEADFDIDALFE